MTWPVAVAGTVHLDNITTPRGTRRDQQGGSMVYFALAAARHAPVHAAGIVGRDGVEGMRAALDGLPVDLAGVAVSEGTTLRWTARHDFDRWIAVDDHEDGGCDPLWDGTLPEAAREAPVLFVGSLRAPIQERVLSQSRARLVGLDSMVGHIARDRSLVHALLEATDVLFLNRSELAALTGDPEERWRDAASGLLGRGRLRAVVVKAGPGGASIVTRAGIVARDAHPVDAVVDPTGAGDALAGGMLGACAAAERDDDEFLCGPALDRGLRAAAAAIRTFGTESLRSGALR